MSSSPSPPAGAAEEADVTPSPPPPPLPASSRPPDHTADAQSRPADITTDAEADEEVAVVDLAGRKDIVCDLCSLLRPGVALIELNLEGCGNITGVCVWSRQRPITRTPLYVLNTKTCPHRGRQRAPRSARDETFEFVRGVETNR